MTGQIIVEFNSTEGNRVTTLWFQLLGEPEKAVVDCKLQFDRQLFPVSEDPTSRVPAGFFDNPLSKLE